MHIHRSKLTAKIIDFAQQRKNFLSDLANFIVWQKSDLYVVSVSDNAVAFNNVIAHSGFNKSSLDKIINIKTDNSTESTIETPINDTPVVEEIKEEIVESFSDVEFENILKKASLFAADISDGADLEYEISLSLPSNIPFEFEEKLKKVTYELYAIVDYKDSLIGEKTDYNSVVKSTSTGQHFAKVYLDDKLITTTKPIITKYASNKEGFIFANLRDSLNYSANANEDNTYSIKIDLPVSTIKPDNLSCELFKKTEFGFERIGSGEPLDHVFTVSDEGVYYIVEYNNGTVISRTPNIDTSKLSVVEKKEISNASFDKPIMFHFSNFKRENKEIGTYIFNTNNTYSEFVSPNRYFYGTYIIDDNGIILTAGDHYYTGEINALTINDNPDTGVTNYFGFIYNKDNEIVNFKNPKVTTTGAMTYQKRHDPLDIFNEQMLNHEIKKVASNINQNISTEVEPSARKIELDEYFNYPVFFEEDSHDEENGFNKLVVCNENGTFTMKVRIDYDIDPLPYYIYVGGIYYYDAEENTISFKMDDECYEVLDDHQIVKQDPLFSFNFGAHQVEWDNGRVVCLNDGKSIVSDLSLYNKKIDDKLEVFNNTYVNFKDILIGAANYYEVEYSKWN